MIPLYCFSIINSIRLIYIFNIFSRKISYIRSIVSITKLC
nr:MAG TPA: hypothetical protein [Bacteriophage sp.]